MKDKFRLARLICCASLATLYLGASGAQVGPCVSAAPITASSSAAPLPDFMLANDKAWESVPWTGDDRPFAAARLSIDRQFHSGSDFKSVVSLYQLIAKVHPKNALDQFQWAYAFYRLGEIPHPTMRDTSPGLYALIKADQPHVYDYDRLRLLYDPALGAADLGLAERLVAKDPTDTNAKWVYVWILSQVNTKVDCEKAISMAEALVTSGQDRPNCYLSLCYVYMNIGLKRGNNLYLSKAIDADEKYLALAPQNDWHRGTAQHVLDWLRKHPAHSGT